MKWFFGLDVILIRFGPAAARIFAANRYACWRPEELTARIHAFDFNTAQPKGLAGSNVTILEYLQRLPELSVKVPAIPPADVTPDCYRRASEQSVANTDAGRGIHPDTGH